MLAPFISFLTLFSLLVDAKFTFTTNQPTQCQQLQVNWSGGTAPFSLTVYPAFAAPVSYSIPASSFSNGQGSFSTGLAFNPNSSNIVAVMSDATGFASGGVSPVIPIGKDTSGCNINIPAPQFTWQSSNAFQQCRPYQLQTDTTATLPLTITILVPGGTFQNFTSSADNYTIQALDVAAGTQLILTVTDAQGRSGGNSDLSPVVQTGDNSCLSGSSPSSTYTSKTTTSTGGSSTTASSSASATSTGTPATTVSGATIGAIVAAVIVGIGAIIALTLFWRKRRQETSRYGRNPRDQVDLALLDSPTLHPVNANFAPEPYTLAAPNPFELDQYQHASPHSSTGFLDSANQTSPRSQAQFSQSQYNQSQYSQSQYGQSQPASSEFGGSGGSQYGQPQTAFTDPNRQSVATTMTGFSGATGPRYISKAAQREQAARRYVQHTDAADEMEPEGDEVVELPPQYSESRRPIPGFQPYQPSTSSTSDSKQSR